MKEAVPCHTSLYSWPLFPEATAVLYWSLPPLLSYFLKSCKYTILFDCSLLSIDFRQLKIVLENFMPFFLYSVFQLLNFLSIQHSVFTLLWIYLIPPNKPYVHGCVCVPSFWSFSAILVVPLDCRPYRIPHFLGLVSFQYCLDFVWVRIILV